MMFWSTLVKPLAAAAAIVVVVSGAVVAQVALQQNSDKPSAAQVAAHAQPSDESVDLGDGVRVEFVGIAPIDARDWHTPAGAAVPAALIKESLAHLSGTQIVMPHPTHQALVRVTAPADANVNLSVPKAAAIGVVDAPSRQEGERIYITHFQSPPNATAVDLEVSVATGQWQTLVTNDTLSDYTTAGSSEGGIVFSEMIESEGKPTIYVATEMQSVPWRVVAFDNDENVLGAHAGNETSSGRLSTCRAVFDVDRERIHAVEVQTRPYNKRVTCRNCTLDPQNPTRPTIETKK